MNGTGDTHHIDPDLSGLRCSPRRANGRGCLPILLPVLQLRGNVAPQARRLLRVLFLRLDSLPTGAAARCRRNLTTLS